MIAVDVNDLDPAFLELEGRRILARDRLREIHRALVMAVMPPCGANQGEEPRRIDLIDQALDADFQIVALHFVQVRYALGDRRHGAQDDIPTGLDLASLVLAAYDRRHIGWRNCRKDG